MSANTALLLALAATIDPAPDAGRRPATQAEIAMARRLYTSHSCADIEIDDAAVVSEADDGVWVQAWVRVDNHGV